MAQQNINDTYILMQSIINKNQQGYLSPDDFNYFINEASKSLFNEYRGKIAQYLNGRPTPKAGYGRTQLITETLSYFFETAALTLASGIATIPDDHIETIDVSSTYNSGRVLIRRVEHDRFYNYTNSVIDTPTTEFPIYMENNQEFQFSPTSLTGVQINYLKAPVTANWGYTISLAGRPTYAPTGGVNGNSVNLEWDETEISNVVMRAISLMGISVKDQQMINWAEAQKAQGS